MSRTTKPIVLVLLSLGTAAALAACDAGKPSSAPAVPTWPSTSSSAVIGGDPATAIPPTDTPSDTPAATATDTPSGAAGPGGGNPASTPAARPGGGKCAPNTLSGRIVPGSPGAGQRYATLVVENTSASSCTLYGYSGLQLIGADGQALPTRVDRTANPGPRLVTLAPGRTASAELHWSAIPGPGEPQSGPCQPNPVRANVIPPDDYSAFSVTWFLGPVCEGGRLDSSAYH